MNNTPTCPASVPFIKDDLTNYAIRQGAKICENLGLDSENENLCLATILLLTGATTLTACYFLGRLSRMIKRDTDSTEPVPDDESDDGWESDGESQVDIHGESQDQSNVESVDLDRWLRKND